MTEVSGSLKAADSKAPAYFWTTVLNKYIYLSKTLLMLSTMDALKKRASADSWRASKKVMWWGMKY